MKYDKKGEEKKKKMTGLRKEKREMEQGMRSEKRKRLKKGKV